jgi:hypothetical protein
MQVIAVVGYKIGASQQQEQTVANVDAVEEPMTTFPLIPDEPQEAAKPVVHMSWLLDNALHTSIIVLAALCYLLYHKALSLYT